MQRRRMDADGGWAVQLERRTRKIAVVVAAQNVLLGACLLGALYVYWDVQGRTSGDDNAHILVDGIQGITGNATLQFGYVHSRTMMGLVDKTNDTIYINCTGPYVLYLDVCYKSLNQKEARAVLQLQVVGSQAPVSNFTLHTSGEVCRGLYSIAYLRAKDQASLHFYSTDQFKVKNVTVGLSYLLGRRCDF